MNWLSKSDQQEHAGILPEQSFGATILGNGSQDQSLERVQHFCNTHAYEISSIPSIAILWMFGMQSSLQQDMWTL